MKLDGLFEAKSCPFALEVFPPKRQSGVASVYDMLDRLGAVPADYISVTYSAGGSGAKEYTAQIAARLKDRQQVEPLAHLTCVNSRREEIEKELLTLRGAGIENILALRGDRQPGTPPCDDYAHASDLMREIRDAGDFYVVGACYPEGHPDSKNLDEDIDYLKVKQDAGAGHFVSQLFFDNVKFFHFVEKTAAKGINCPIEAGVMPIVKPEQIERTVSLSSASLPSAFTRWVSRYADDREAFFDAGIDYAVRQIRQLIVAGCRGIHLYAMNNPDVAGQVYEGIRDLL